MRAEKVSYIIKNKVSIVLLNDVCRIRHIGTGKYLSVNPTDKRELMLKEMIDSSDTLFRLHRETHRPLHTY